MSRAFLIRTYKYRPRPYIRFARMANFSAKGPLMYNDGPLVWVDCEMTGLDPDKDKIIEIAVLITNGSLDLVDGGIQYVIKTDKSDLDAMDEWCTNQHGSSGLTQACLDSPYTHDFVRSSVLEYIKKWIPYPRVGVLAGNTVHMDRVFLTKHMSEITDWLHYRIVDVSSIKELARRWYPNLPPYKSLMSSHRALDDIRGSIEELRKYRENIFVPPEAVQNKGTK
ncbi:hypothetical protein M422DRAFT_26722, partial [Sphaerobolus stellatus SS14]